MADTKQDKSKGDKPKKRSRVKETFAELKKVTWPTFGKTMKQTGAVFVVTIFFLIVLLVIDQLLGLAHSKLIEKLNEGVTMINTFSVSLKGSVGAIFTGVKTLPLLI